MSARVIVIGGSAGALEVLLAILPTLPATRTTPIVIVLHLAPTPPSLVPALLERATALRVIEVEDKQPLLPGTIHVAPANYHVLFERDATLALSVDEAVNFSRPSIDVSFESVARAFGPGAIGILLSGANDDGAVGLWHIAEAGGLAVVQDPATARQPIMPRAAIHLLRTRARVAAPGNIAAILAGSEDGPGVQEQAG
jgi:two-component system chemotaxis response regulator CheB